MIDAGAKEAFWKVVEECLVEFHRLKARTARTRTAALRKRIEDPPCGLADELIYHAEPFDVACDIAGEPLQLSAYRNQYEAIASKHEL